jgi:hypothetical protein
MAQLDKCKCQHTRENHYMEFGKCIYVGCSCGEFSIEQNEEYVRSTTERYIPTKEEVIAAGYTPEAADRVIAREINIRDGNPNA